MESTLRRAGALLFLALSLAPLGGCAMFEKAANKDPLKCERDPDCARRAGKNRDCTTQCNDDPDCMERCEQMQGGR